MGHLCQLILPFNTRLSFTLFHFLASTPILRKWDPFYGEVGCPHVQCNI